MILLVLWARQAACLSDRYLESDEDPAPSPPDTAEEDAMPDLSGGGVKDVIPPQNISAPQPRYTRLARRARVQGVVIVQAMIDKNGNVKVDRVVKGLPGCLTEEAVLAIEKWKFRPAQLNGKPIDVYYNLTVNFRLTSTRGIVSLLGIFCSDVTAPGLSIRLGNSSFAVKRLRWKTSTRPLVRAGHRKALVP